MKSLMPLPSRASDTLGAGLINLPLLILDGLAYAIGIPLTILFCIHSFMALTSSTTHEFMKVEKLQYLKVGDPFSPSPRGQRWPHQPPLIGLMGPRD